MPKNLAGTYLPVKAIFVFLKFAQHQLKHMSLLMKMSGAETNYKIVQSMYKGSWRKMWVQRPRIRNDGKYSLSTIWCARVNVLIMTF